jgi:ABC-type Mn2+/Zn2+ transport system ATPase subunit
MRGTISEGVIFVAPTLFGKLLANFRSLLGKLTEYRVAEAARERLDHICDGQFVNIMQRKSIQRGQPTIAKEAAFLIKLENAAFSYGSQVILSAASLSIEARKRYCVVGQNGAGKSTLIDILLGYQPVEGIHFSIDMSQASVCSRYFNLPDVPVCELMTCMSKHEYFNKEAVGELIHALDVEHLQERPLSRMSLGEQQRIRILFALLKDAEIYIFDEPLAHIALIDHPAIMQLILRRTREKTIIIVSHEPYSSEEHFDEIIEIKNKTLLTNPAKARHYA